MENCPAVPLPREKWDFEIVERGALQGAFERFSEHGRRAARNHSTRAGPAIPFAIAGFKAAAVGVTDEARGVEHENHALRVV